MNKEATDATRALASGFAQVMHPRTLGRELLANELLKLQIGHLSHTSARTTYKALAQKCAEAAKALYEELDRA